MSKFIDAFKSAGEAELAEVNKRIEDLQAELDALHVIRKALDVRVNGKPEKPAGGVKKKGELAQKIFDCITQNGPGTTADIALKLGTVPAAIGKAASACGWFRKTADGKLVIART